MNFIVLDCVGVNLINGMSKAKAKGGAEQQKKKEQIFLQKSSTKIKHMFI
jgi:hypothetical protein